MTDEKPELGAELRLLAETLLERIEPALRKAAAGVDKEEWGECSWCPMCAVAALVRGEHHDVLGNLADHGTNIVTVLREALSGTPVDPRLPEEGAEPTAEPAKPVNGHANNGRATNNGRAAQSFVQIPVTIKS